MDMTEQGLAHSAVHQGVIYVIGRNRTAAELEQGPAVESGGLCSGNFGNEFAHSVDGT